MTETYPSLIEFTEKYLGTPVRPYQHPLIEAIERGETIGIIRPHNTLLVQRKGANIEVRPAPKPRPRITQIFIDELADMDDEVIEQIAEATK